MSIAPSRMLADLTEQHEQIRKLMRRCELLADDVEGGYTEARVLWAATDELRQALDAHNRFEERLLRPALRELDAFGDVRIEQMVVDHVAEHQALNDHLKAGTIDALRAAIGFLRAHLASEEQSFVTSRVLRGDVGEKEKSE
jgi:hypothetical protein